MEAKLQENHIEGKIETIPGKNRVLLIAPHGFMGNGSPGYEADDERAGELARKMAHEFKFYAVINEKYKRVEKLEQADKSKGLINCGRIDQVELIADEFLVPILNSKEQILAKHGDPLVVFIHGIDDYNMQTYIKDFGANPEIAILIGYGQNNGQEGRTATPELVEAFKKSLSENGYPRMVALEADPLSEYCGGDENNLSQLFRHKDYTDTRVHSLQLEIKKSFRERGSVEETGQAIGTALLKLIENNKPAIVENAPDQVLVDRAHRRLASIFSGYFENAMREAGHYLIDEFYGGDFERARHNKPVKGQSLNQLITRLRPKESGGPSKSWIYNAINLVVQNHDLKSFQTYGNLELSKKVELLRVGDPNDKKRLIEQTVKSNLPVRQLREKIAELRHRDQRHLPAHKTLSKVIDKPDALFTDEYMSSLTADSLAQLDSNKLDDLLARAERKRSKIDEDIKSLTEYARNYDRLIELIGTAKKQKSRETVAEGMPKGRRDRMYLWMSALQKAIRWCEINEARYFAQELIEMGMPGAALNRLMIIAAEDIGLADPTLLKYVGDSLDKFEAMLKEYDTTPGKVSGFPEIRAVIDRAVIAAALSYKSRLLPMLSFATLFEIYQKEDFTHDLSEYANGFQAAIQRQDEKKAAYYGYTLGLILDSEDSVFEIIQESKTRNTKLIDEWTQEYSRTKERLMLAGIISLLCRDLSYAHGEYRNQISDWLSLPIEEAQIPDRAYDMHTRAKRAKGRGLEHFLDEAASVRNERFPNSWEESGRKAYLQAREEGIKKSAAVIEAIKEKAKNIRRGNSTRGFIVDLPFEYKRALLTQARTRRDWPFAFIVEFPDGSRKFMKGPFKNISQAQDHITYNEVKRRLESKYLHPIQCEMREYGSQRLFLVCQELGKADLNNVEKKETKLDGTFEVLSCASNDAVPDPLNFLTGINKENQHIWIGMMVNYCFRWVFGLGDAAGRNLMLERSTGKIYSTDEIFLRASSHEDIWGGKKPAKEKFELIRTFAKSGLLNEVLVEVKRWRNSLDTIRREVAPISEEVERRIDQFLENPEMVLGLKDAKRREPRTRRETNKNPEMAEKNWNVITGCTKDSDGCKNCYAKVIADRFLKRKGDNIYKRHGFNPTFHESRIDWPLKIKSKERPLRSFVTDMGDLFHKDISDEIIHRIFETMLKVPHARFYALTKRAERLGSLGPKLPWKPWIWAGVTVESNRYIDRIPHLKKLPPEVNKFIIMEPLLSDMPELNLSGIDWVIVGGETGPNFRPMKEEWVIGIRDQVKKAGLPFLFKHWSGKTQNTKKALLEGRIWADYPESVVNNVDWNAKK